MQKAYSLLRNNKQSGPYSLEEMIQMGLKPNDLIWVEGRSAGWRYPAEIETLKQYIPQESVSEITSVAIKVEDYQQNYFKNNAADVHSKSAKGSQVFVRLPGNLNTVILNASTQEKINKSSDTQPSDTSNKFINEIQDRNENILREKYSRTLNQVEDDYTNWVFKRKKRSPYGISNRSSVLIFCVLIVLAILGLVIKYRENPTDRITGSAIQSPIVKLPGPMQDMKIKETTPSMENNSAQNTNTNPTLNKQAKATGKALTKTIEKKQVKKNPKYHTYKASNPTQSFPTVKHYPKTKVEMLPERSLAFSDKIGTIKTNEKKKGLSNALNNLVSRFKHQKQEENSYHHSQATIPEQMPGERNSRHRMDENQKVDNTIQTPETPAPKPSEELIEITSNEKNEEHWQLGIYNLKLSLHNHNTLPVRNAIVAISYFDENNRLLDKRSLNFTNIPARGTITLNAPDQKWADHIEYVLETVK